MRNAEEIVLLLPYFAFRWRTRFHVINSNEIERVMNDGCVCKIERRRAASKSI